MTAWCTECRRSVGFGTPAICGDCRRHQAYGVIVDTCVGNGIGLDVLDALSRLMGITTRMRRAHDRALLQESLDAQRGASDAYREDVADGRVAEQ